MANKIFYKTVFPEKAPNQVINEQVVLNSYTRRNIRNRKSLDLDLLSSDNFENDVIDELVTILDENVKLERITVESENNFKNGTLTNGYFKELHFLSQRNADINRIEIKAPVTIYENSDTLCASNSCIVNEDTETQYYLKLWDRYNNFLGCSTNAVNNKRDDVYVFNFNNIKCDGFFVKCTVSKDNINRKYLLEKKEKLFINYTKANSKNSVIKSFVPLGEGAISFSTSRKRNNNIDPPPGNRDKIWITKSLLKYDLVTPGYLEKFTIKLGANLNDAKSNKLMRTKTSADLWVHFFKVIDNNATYIGSSTSPITITDSKTYPDNPQLDEKGQSLSDYQKIYEWKDFNGIYDGKIFFEPNANIGIIFTTENVEDKQSVWDNCIIGGGLDNNSNAPLITLRMVGFSRNDSVTKNWARGTNNELIIGNIYPYYEFLIDEKYNENIESGLTYYPNINVYYTESMILTDKIYRIC